MSVTRFALALVLTSATTAAAQYVVTALPPLSPFDTEAYDINAAGSVVGSGATASLAIHATRWTGQAVIDLGQPGNPLSRAYGISAGGIVAGDERNGDGLTEAAVWTGDEVTYLGWLPGDVGSRAQDCNDAGLVVGWSTGPGGTRRAVVWQDGFPAPIDGNASQSWAFATNAAGLVVGQRTVGPMVQAFRWSSAVLAPLPDLGAGVAGATNVSENGWVSGSATSTLDGKEHAVLWNDGGQVFDLGLLDGTHPSKAWDVTDAGVAVGSALVEPVGEVRRAVLFTNGEVIDLNTRLPDGSGWVLEEARAINASGAIVGFGTFDGQPATQAFLLEPDCNENGVPDAQEVLVGTALDSNGNTIPDVCEYCQADLGFQGPGTVSLWVCGDELVGPGTAATISMQGAQPFAPLFLVIGFQNLPTPAKGGILVPVPPAILLGGLVAGPDGSLAFGTGGGGRLPVPIFLQYVALNGPVYEFSNAVELIIGV